MTFGTVFYNNRLFHRSNILSVDVISSVSIIFKLVLIWSRPSSLFKTTLLIKPLDQSLSVRTNIERSPTSSACICALISIAFEKDLSWRHIVIIFVASKDSSLGVLCRGVDLKSDLFMRLYKAKIISRSPNQYKTLLNRVTS